MCPGVELAGVGEGASGEGELRAEAVGGAEGDEGLVPYEVLDLRGGEEGGGAGYEAARVEEEGCEGDVN